MRIKKIATALLNGLILNTKSDSIDNTYSCDYINKLVKISDISDRNGVIEIGDVLIQYGYVSGLTIPASANYTDTVTFSQSFENVPVIMLTPAGNYNLTMLISASKVDSFTYNFRNQESVERTNRAFFWFAIGKKKD